jgi:hypothetical protein
MMVGPQIMSAIIFVTTGNPIQTSLVFIAGVGVATTVGVAIALALQELFDISLGGSDSSTSSGNVVQYVLIGLLVLAALKNWRGRETVERLKRLSGGSAFPSRS